MVRKKDDKLSLIDLRVWALANDIVCSKVSMFPGTIYTAFMVFDDSYHRKLAHGKTEYECLKAAAEEFETDPWWRL